MFYIPQRIFFFLPAERNKNIKLHCTTMEELEEVSFQFLRQITDDFSKERKVGQGAFGTVYRVSFRHVLSRISPTKVH